MIPSYYQVKLAHGFNKGSMKEKDVISPIDSGVQCWHTLLGVKGGVGQMKSNKGSQFYQQDRIYDSEEIALCQSASESFNPWYKQNLRIRKLTPKECWRLMGFEDEDFEKASQVNSDSQLYKQAGNSIVVDVLEAIFKEML